MVRGVAWTLRERRRVALGIESEIWVGVIEATSRPGPVAEGNEAPSREDECEDFLARQSRRSLRSAISALLIRGMEMDREHEEEGREQAEKQ